MKEIIKYFPYLTDKQVEQYEALFDLYSSWNMKINVISRKDIDNLYVNHVLHSLAIAKYIDFKDGTKVIDVGTGGGFPGIPLAIMFPEVDFVLLDSIKKKIMVTSEVAKAIGLENVDCRHLRIEDEKEKFNFVVSRAVMSLDSLIKVVKKNINKEQLNSLPNGLICLKGGDLTEEIKRYRKIVDVVDLSSYFEEPFFDTKKLVYVPID
ncbi:MAG: 16S rRNA (guanine(527)-N(7))-methyltransferase RsmG [Fermentimonas sp.]